MRNHLLFGIFCLLLGLIAACGGDPTAAFDGESAFDFAATQVAFGPRYPGSEGHANLQYWLEETLDDLGWMVERQNFSYSGLQLTNFIARLTDEASNEAPILIGTHYDTRPRADQDLLHPDQPVLGANDGASGVAVLLELARLLSNHRPDQDIWLVFFDAEDSGNLDGWDWTVGSTYFANHLTVVPQGVIIVDMVGDRDLQIYYDRNSDHNLSVEIWQVADELGMEGFIQEFKHAMIDDHTPFIRLGIPAIDIIDFDYPAWHTTQDNLDRISAESLEQVGQTLLTWIHQLSP